MLEFLGLPEEHTEADLHSGLLRHLGRFINELGRDFAFIGSQYPVQVGGRDFALDLLFFHRDLNCLVAIELKVEEFQPEHLGKLQYRRVPVRPPEERARARQGVLPEEPRSRPPARLARQGRAGLERPRRQRPALYIQEKVHPKVLIDDLLSRTKSDDKASEPQLDLFGDFNGIPKGADKTEFYQHDQNWSNRMILGDSLQVMASLAEREGLRGKVQCIYFDPPYGIKFNSNFQWSTTSRDVKDGATSHITREPEQVKAFRDTRCYGIHSYLTYLRDRLTVAHDLLTDSGRSSSRSAMIALSPLG
jgi:hypothetical protein